ncbi:DUF2179 domain-containing protein [Mycoplasma phocimorsus]|uniref:DUF2179 domain-containing protein n=1 Tax=Mycoplasma phocimorsus TaxID=3045839 RepID=UPI0024C05081|nr:DUF2179 domain-containing protein [Mycoplasma phocimorsus]MDJ1646391.1 DUF2179 domain-containing protein [Mycoplasma phocimorsus]
MEEINEKKVEKSFQKEKNDNFLINEIKTQKENISSAEKKSPLSRKNIKYREKYEHIKKITDLMIEKYKLLRNKENKNLIEIYYCIKYNRLKKAQDKYKKLSQPPKHRKAILRLNTKYKRNYISNFALKLSFLYKPRKLWFILFISTILGIIYGTTRVFLVGSTGIYDFGIAAIGQGIAKLTMALLWNSNINITPDQLRILYEILFWSLYIIISIPLFILSYKKLGKEFTFISVVFLVIGTLVANSIGIFLNKYGLSNWLPFGEISKVGNSSLSTPSKVLSILPITWSDGGETILMVVYAILYGLVLAISFAIIGILGGTAGVSGIIGEIYSRAKHKSFAQIAGYMNFAIMIVSIFIGSYLAGNILLSKVNSMGLNETLLYESGLLKYTSIPLWTRADMYFSPNFFATFVSNFVFTVFLNKLYPRYKFVRVEIISKEIEQIKKAILEDERSFNQMVFYDVKAGYSQQDYKMTISITLFTHVPRMIKRIHKLDPNAFINVQHIRNVQGFVYVPEGKF